MFKSFVQRLRSLFKRQKEWDGYDYGKPSEGDKDHWRNNNGL